MERLSSTLKDVIDLRQNEITKPHNNGGGVKKYRHEYTIRKIQLRHEYTIRQIQLTSGVITKFLNNRSEFSPVTSSWRVIKMVWDSVLKMLQLFKLETGTCICGKVD